MTIQWCSSQETSDGHQSYTVMAVLSTLDFHHIADSGLSLEGFNVWNQTL